MPNETGTVQLTNQLSEVQHKHLGRPRLTKVFLLFQSLRKTKVVALTLALIMALPLLTLIAEAASSSGEGFAHIRETVLFDYVINTLYLVVLVGVFAALLGIPLAWLIANCQFPGRALFNWALVLPLAMPGYLIAYTYTDLFDYAGPIQTWLRSVFGWTSPHDYWFFDIRSIPGAALMLALVLFPYVYLLVRANFSEQSATLTHAARVLGKTPWQSFKQVSLPLARRAIVASSALVMMEAMADFATVNYFAVNTLTTAVYDTWLGHYDLASAAKLSTIMVFGIFVLLYLESVHHGKKQTGNDAKVSQQTLCYQLSGHQAWLAFTFCLTVLTMAFLLPGAILLDYAVDYFNESWNEELWQFSVNSITIALITASIGLLVAVTLNHLKRFWPTTGQSMALKIASSGYAIPGTVMAIGVLIPLAFLDNQINQIAELLNLQTPGLILSGTMVAIIFAHICRFAAIANNSIESNYQKLSRSLDNAGRNLGHTPRQVLTKIHLPLYRRSAVVAFLLIFVESMKELPAALLLRPFDFQSLPTYVYQFASDEQLELAALGALAIVLVGLIPLYFLNRSIDKNQ